MFCPKCSQQQISDETRFCSRCGFQLQVVKALLVSENLEPDEQFQKADRGIRTRDLTLGVLLMFIVALIVALITIDMPPVKGAQFTYLLIAWLVVTLLIYIKPLISHLVKGEVFSPEKSETINPLASFTENSKRRTLPASQSISADIFTGSEVDRTKTPPPSVTERTTNQLRSTRPTD